MGSIRGRYEWDDDDLTPGRKAEGGLHQNLFDKEGNLKGSARFIPTENSDEPLVVTETVYVPIEERRRSQADEHLERIINELLAQLVQHGIAGAKPYVQQFWREKARPVIDSGRVRVKAARDRRAASKVASHAPVTVEAEILSGASELAVQEGTRPKMSSAEAQARLLAALAARAYSDEQMRTIEVADIIEGHDLAALEQSLTELPPAQLKALLEAMVLDPAMLGESSLAEIASALGRQRLPEAVRRPELS